MSDLPIPPRPPTPQVLLHRLPDKPEEAPDDERKPSKYIILIMGSTEVAGKVQIARSVASALSCPLFQGDSLHESAAKAASVGSSRPAAAASTSVPSPTGAPEGTSVASGPNEARYQRMWLSKMTRTGLLFPEESRPATEGFSGFGGTSSAPSSRRGSISSVASVSSDAGTPSSAAASSSLVSSRRESLNSPHPAPPVTTTFPTGTSSYIHNPVFTLSEHERLRRSNPALMVLTHPGLAKWHKLAIRTSVGEYGIGVIFVPLYDDHEEDEEELPVLRPLDPRTMTSFPTSFANFGMKARGWGNLHSEMKLRIDTDADVEAKTAEIIDGVKSVMDVDE